MYKFIAIVCFLNALVLGFFTPLMWGTETTGETKCKQIIQKIWLTLVAVGIIVLLFFAMITAWNK